MTDFYRFSQKPEGHIGVKDGGAELSPRPCSEALPPLRTQSKTRVIVRPVRACAQTCHQRVKGPFADTAFRCDYYLSRYIYIL